MQAYDQISYGAFGDDTEDQNDPRNNDIVPLVINTMGWTKGLGANLLKNIQQIVEPSHVFDFESAYTDDRETGYDGPGFNADLNEFIRMS